MNMKTVLWNWPTVFPAQYLVTTSRTKNYVVGREAFFPSCQFQKVRFKTLKISLSHYASITCHFNFEVFNISLYFLIDIQFSKHHLLKRLFLAPLLKLVDYMGLCMDTSVQLH